MRSLLSLDPKVITDLGPEEAIQAFRLLLCAEAARLGIPPTAINVPASVTVADGGIDATVDTKATLPQQGLICCSTSRYQIKTGETFKPWQEAMIRKELFGDKVPGNKEHLGPAVRKCLDDGGTYVVVCFGHDVVAKDLDDSKKLLVSHVTACGYSASQVEVLGQSHLVSLFEQFPALVRRLSRLSDHIRDHRSWSQDFEMSRPFKTNAEQDKFIDALRAALRSEDSKHIRVCGEAGIGKTRLVLEATRVDDLASRVLYCQATDILDSGLLQTLTDDPRLHAVLVVDECDPDTRARLADRLAAHAKRVRVVSIYQDPDQSAGINLLMAPVLEEPVIVEIISSYGAPKDVAQRWAPLCDGSPRVAHVMGENLRTNPEDILKPPSTNNIWDRYVRGVRTADDPLAGQVRTVLRFLSLFQRFGFEQPVGEEAKAIAAIVEEADRQITWHRFCEVVKELRQRRILQGERTLYITPQALHIWLWSEWWDTYGDGFEIDPFVGKLKGELLKWFVDMWRYAHRSKAAIRVVDRLAGPTGPFADGALLRTELGSSFLLALTDASPEAVLGCLERTVGAWSHEELVQFTSGRGNVRFALERIVVWRHLFARGARLLLALAAAENERWSNNSTGVFAALFSPGRGPVAPTEASPEERFPILAEALTAEQPERRQVGLKAADKALESGHFSRMSGSEYQGLRSPPQLWTPKTWGELFDAYRRVWRFLEEGIEKAGPKERTAIVGVLLQRARGLIRYPNLADECIATLQRLASQGRAEPKAVMDVCEDALTYDKEKLKPEHAASITKLRDELVGTGFAGRLHRFIGMNRLEDRREQGKPSGRWETIADELADEAIRQPDLLRTEIPWLVTADAENAGPFGYRIGKRDSARKFLSQSAVATMAAGEKRSLMFLGGYMRALFESDPIAWEEELDRWANDATRDMLVPELTWRSGMTDRAAQRILTLMRRGTLKAAALGLLRFGRATEELSEPVFRELIEQLLQEPSFDAAALAVELVQGYYERGDPKRSVPEDLAERVLTEPQLLAEGVSNDQSLTGYLWVQLASALVERKPEVGPRLLGIIIDLCEDRNRLLSRHEADLSKLARAILSARPIEAWEVLQRRLSGDDKMSSYTTLQWVGGGDLDEDAAGLWDAIPLERLWGWVDERVDERAWLVATSVPRSLDQVAGLVTRDLLRRYGDRDDVRRNLLARFSSGFWWGRASDRFGEMKKAAENWRAAESEPRIREWLDLYIAELTDEIERSRVREERDSR